MSTPQPPTRLRDPRRVPRALGDFLSTEAAAGMAIMAAVLVALLWANSPWQASYRALWATELEIRVGRHGVHEDLRHWVNDALMAFFFFVVALEIKRELVWGELRHWRAAALPALAAVGGMVVPAGLYLLINGGGPAARGWGIPMATDIALALGVVAIIGRRVPSSGRVFLLTLAIVDDILAIAVIAVFYTGGIRWLPLALAVALLSAIALLQRTRVFWMPLFALLAVVVWFCVYRSGVHATLAGVALGFLVPARARAPSQVVRRWNEDLADDPSPEDAEAMERVAHSGISVAERLEHSLHRFTAFLVVPVFALANAGLRFGAADLQSPGAKGATLGIFLGLAVGKVLGVTGFAMVAVRSGIGSLPADLRWPHMVGLGWLAGIGFTVSLFITGLAFDRPQLADASTLAVMAASLTAALLGGGILWAAGRSKQ